ncbi:class I SAM-dependent methyltransferase [Sebaldella sp. S0638]|uniref:class I SAM-dependent DNA methyltransferase n=1 Tax=Sebaldella sp. S0638 TaxID=2957809 RepID=UPI00209F83F9|nr:class I SAM-dependent methyltransferase [Sebaldella sp. S0638]MCP1223976.1 class I SAM-dependent methyltransferase [Sebaldella sp. S0638]
MHKEFANIYDVFMESVNYEDWYKYLRKYIKKAGTVLDLGCGTGEFLVRFSKDGFSSIGVDISEVMLEIAGDKTKESKDVELYQGDIRNFRAEKPVDYVVCNFDTVNYFDKFGDLEDFLLCSYENLKENGILIFDVVTEEIFEEMFENGVFLDEKENYLTIWRYNKEGENYIINIKLFIREKENLFRNYEEVHVKTIFDLEEIANKALETGFDIVDIKNDEEFGENRFFFILKK